VFSPPEVVDLPMHEAIKTLQNDGYEVLSTHAASFSNNESATADLRAYSFPLSSHLKVRNGCGEAQSRAPRSLVAAQQFGNQSVRQQIESRHLHTA
jgi:hypothetical protein